MCAHTPDLDCVLEEISLVVWCGVEAVAVAVASHSVSCVLYLGGMQSQARGDLSLLRDLSDDFFSRVS